MAPSIFDLVLGNQIAKIQPADNMVGCFWFGASLLLTDEHFWIGAPKARPPCALRQGRGAFCIRRDKHHDKCDAGRAAVAKILPRDYDGTVVSGGGVAGCALCAFGAAIARMPAADDSDSFPSLSARRVPTVAVSSTRLVHSARTVRAWLSSMVSRRHTQYARPPNTAPTVYLAIQLLWSHTAG